MTSGSFSPITTPNGTPITAEYSPRYIAAGLVDPIVININEPGDSLPPCGLQLMDGGNLPLRPPPGYLYSVATVGIKILKDGGPHPIHSNVVYGLAGGSSGNPTQTVRWVDGGDAEIISSLAGYEVAYAAADGKFLSLRRPESQPGAYVYSPALGVRSLIDVLTADYGVDTTGMFFERILGMAGVGESNFNLPAEIGADEIAVGGTLNGMQTVWWIKLYRIPIGIEGSEARWTNLLGGQWMNPLNWQSNTSPTGSDALPIFDLPSPYNVSVNTTLGIAGLVINQGEVTFDLDGRTHHLNSIQTAACDNFSSLIGRDPGLTATAILTNGTIATQRGTRTGAGTASTGNLIVELNGRYNATAIADSSASKIQIASGPNSSGTLTVRQSGHVEANGIEIAAGIGSNAALSVDGATSSLESAILVVGSRGAATASVTNSATLQVSELILGALAGASGTMNLSTSSEEVRINGGQAGVVIGDRGVGNLTMTGGGGILLNADGAGFNTLDIARGDQGQGTLNINGPSQIIETTSVLRIASGRESNGTLNINGGATVNMHIAALARGPDSTGAINISGISSRFLINEGALGGFYEIDIAGRGTASITAGGLLQTDFDLRLQDAATLFASGPGSQIFIGGYLHVNGFRDGSNPPLYARVVIGDRATISTRSADLYDAFVEVTGEAIWNNGQTIRIHGGAADRPTTIRVGSGSYIVANELDISGPAVLDTPRIIVGTGNLTDEDGITVATLSVDDTSRVAGITVDLRADATFAAAGTWSGHYGNSGTLLVGGTRSKDVIGILDITGDFVQDPGGILDVRLGSYVLAFADSLNVTGQAMLSGILRISSFSRPLAPDSDGQQVPIIAASGVTGTFDAIDASSLPQGFSVVPIYTATEVLLAISYSPCNPDYNQDGGGDNSDVLDLANDIASGTQSFPPNTVDFNNDGGGDLSDILDLANVVAGGLCP